MRTKGAALAVAALLSLGTGSVVAAMDAPTVDTISDDALPANHTVDVINSGEVSDEAVDKAIQTAWTNETVRSYFDDDAAVHFEVWASGVDDEVIHVDVAPVEEPGETRVIADVDPSEQQVISTDEPVKLNATNAITINASDYDINDTGHSQDANGEENATRLTADQAAQIELDESSVEHGVNGTFTFEVEDDDGTTTTVRSDEIIRIDLSPANRTVSGK
jgi:hypothetical protein